MERPGLLLLDFLPLVAQCLLLLTDVRKPDGLFIDLLLQFGLFLEQRLCLFGATLFLLCDWLVAFGTTEWSFEARLWGRGSSRRNSGLSFRGCFWSSWNPPCASLSERVGGTGTMR